LCLHELSRTFKAINKGYIYENYFEEYINGILLIAPPREVKNIEMMQEAGFPLVCVGNHPANNAVDYVDIDNYAAGRQLTELLIENGYTKIIHIAEIEANNLTLLE
jgi:DNA-binding LacI/PurR family transcriptional regulator